MYQQLARPFGLVVEDIAHGVFGDVAPDQPKFTALDLGIGLLEAPRPIAQALDLGPRQHNPAFERLEDFVLVVGPPVTANGLQSVAVCFLAGCHGGTLPIAW